MIEPRAGSHQLGLMTWRLPMEFPRKEPRKCSGCGAVLVLWSAKFCKSCYVELTFGMDDLQAEAA